jgi:hypothetical protein
MSPTGSTRRPHANTGGRGLAAPTTSRSHRRYAPPCRVVWRGASPPHPPPAPHLTSAGLIGWAPVGVNVRGGPVGLPYGSPSPP